MCVCLMYIVHWRLGGSVGVLRQRYSASCALHSRDFIKVQVTFSEPPPPRSLPASKLDIIMHNYCGAGLAATLEEVICLSSGFPPTQPRKYKYTFNSPTNNTGLCMRAEAEAVGDGSGSGRSP